MKKLVLALVLVLVPALVNAQTPPAATQPEPERADPDVRIDPLQPDFTLVALPTTLRMPRGKWAFRVTHRFSRPLGEGDFQDLAASAFGFDASAIVGLEVRYGLMRGTQIGVHRTSDRTIQIFGQHNFRNERDGARFGLDALATLEGRNNLREHYQSALGVILSKNAGRYAALYVEPIVVVNSNAFETGDNSTFMVGVGGRVRVRSALYLVGEVTPRVAGNDPGTHQASFGVEGRAGGHLFQLNFSNGFWTTFGQIARGAVSNDNWYIGFNISRKFF